MIDALTLIAPDRQEIVYEIDLAGVDNVRTFDPPGSRTRIF